MVGEERLSDYWRLRSCSRAMNRLLADYSIVWKCLPWIDSVVQRA